MLAVLVTIDQITGASTCCTTYLADFSKHALLSD